MHNEQYVINFATSTRLYTCKDDMLATQTHCKSTWFAKLEATPLQPLTAYCRVFSDMQDHCEGATPEGLDKEGRVSEVGGLGVVGHQGVGGQGVPGHLP